MEYRIPELFVNLESTNEYLNLRQCGYDHCVPGYCYGPSIRDFYLIHYITDGQGSYTSQGTTYHLNAGDAFLIKPNEITTYTADSQNPWSYCFFAFDGNGAENYLSRTSFYNDNLAISLNCETLKDIIIDTTKTLLDNIFDSDIYALSQLLNMLRFFVNQPCSNPNSNKPCSSILIQQALDFIHLNYASAITVSSISDMLSINRSYFCRLFKKELNISPIEYLNTYRLEKARHFLINTKMPINQISIYVGFPSFSSFYRFFKIKYGYSPQNYRIATERNEPNVPGYK